MVRGGIIRAVDRGRIQRGGCMQSIVNIGELEEIATDEVDGVLFNSGFFETDPRLSGLVSEALAAHNDLPPNLGNLLDALRSGLSDAASIAKLVELNPAIAAKVLKLVNSSFASLRGKVGNLKRAVSLLGFNVINSLLISTSVFIRNNEHKLPPTLPVVELWQHSVAVGQIAGAIANRLGNLDSATLVSCGLLHDAGKLVLAQIHPEKFASCILAARENGTNLIDKELETMGLTHPLLSGALGKMWYLPERLWSTLVFQDNVELSPSPKMTAVLGLAQYLARERGLGFDGQAPDDSVIYKAAEVLEIPVESAPRLVDNIKMDEIVRDCHLLAS